MGGEVGRNWKEYREGKLYGYIMCVGKIHFKEKKYILLKLKHLFFSIIGHFQNHYCQ